MWDLPHDDSPQWQHPRLAALSLPFVLGTLEQEVCPVAGIFVNDILDAVPIDKYFELFKPGAGGEGGYIRISINFVKDLKDLDKSTGTSIKHLEYSIEAKVRGNGYAGQGIPAAALEHGLG